MKYEISNIIEFTENARRLVFSGFGKAIKETEDEFTEMLEELSSEEENEMNLVLTQQESLLIVESIAKKQKSKKTKKIRYIISEDMFSEILEALNARLVSNILSNLAQKGLIESAYDDTLNDFVFWVKEDAKNKDQT